MYLTSPNLGSVVHGFFTRKGGVSDGIYASLNCGWGSSDHPSNVAENRRRVANALGADAEHLCSLNQIHSAAVVTVTEPWSRTALPQADAMVTNRPGLALGVLSADCVPILLADQQARVIGAAHSGWKGAVAGVIEETVKAMCALGATPAGISAAIGPAIGLESYEVGQEFYDRILLESAENYSFFVTPSASGQWRFDIKGYVRRKLSMAGISLINTLENNTYLEEDDFFSFRRSTHRSEKDYGRQISAIILT